MSSDVDFGFGAELIGWGEPVPDWGENDNVSTFSDFNFDVLETAWTMVRGLSPVRSHAAYFCSSFFKTTVL